jgi:hypothetical protein
MVAASIFPAFLGNAGWMDFDNDTHLEVLLTGEKKAGKFSCSFQMAASNWNDGNEIQIGAFMNILILNCGSSSLKFQIIETDLEVIEQNTDKQLAKGVIERIGSEALITLQANANSVVKQASHCATIAPH